MMMNQEQTSKARKVLQSSQAASWGSYDQESVRYLLLGRHGVLKPTFIGVDS